LPTSTPTVKGISEQTARQKPVASGEFLTRKQGTTPVEILKNALRIGSET